MVACDWRLASPWSPANFRMRSTPGGPLGGRWVATTKFVQLYASRSSRRILHWRPILPGRFRSCAATHVGGGCGHGCGRHHFSQAPPRRTSAKKANADAAPLSPSPTSEHSFGQALPRQTSAKQANADAALQTPSPDERATIRASAAASNLWPRKPKVLTPSRVTPAPMRSFIREGAAAPNLWRPALSVRRRNHKKTFVHPFLRPPVQISGTKPVN